MKPAETNRALWDRWVDLHMRSEFYDVAGFRAGASSLKPLEREELGDVAGRSLLHLQCHFGMDTISWARLGARVTGVDFSEPAVEAARGLARELSTPARFVPADVLELDLGERFDVVFTSYGAICWLEDLARWAHTIVRHLRPGGVFYMVEFHPLAGALSDDGRRLEAPYLSTGRAERYDQSGSYADPGAGTEHPSYEWHHGLGDVVAALLAAGLELEFLREHAWSSYGCFPYLQQEGPHRWVIRGGNRHLPLMFSIRAHARR